MNYISQIAIIAAISFAGEILGYFIPLPIPGSIYGLILMFTLLCLRVIKLPQVKDTAHFLITLMPIMFVSPLVGLMESYEKCLDFIVPILLVSTLGTVAVMAVTGLVSQALIRIKEGKQSDK